MVHLVHRNIHPAHPNTLQLLLNILQLHLYIRRLRHNIRQLINIVPQAPAIRQLLLVIHLICQSILPVAQDIHRIPQHTLQRAIIHQRHPCIRPQLHRMAIRLQVPQVQPIRPVVLLMKKVTIKLKGKCNTKIIEGGRDHKNSVIAVRFFFCFS